MVQIHLRTCLNYRQIQTYEVSSVRKAFQTEDFFLGARLTMLDLGKVCQDLVPQRDASDFHRKFKVRNDCILNIKIMTRQNSLIGKAYDSYL